MGDYMAYWHEVYTPDFLIRHDQQGEEGEPLVFSTAATL